MGRVAKAELTRLKLEHGPFTIAAHKHLRTACTWEMRSERRALVELDARRQGSHVWVAGHEHRVGPLRVVATTMALGACTMIADTIVCCAIVGLLTNHDAHAR